MPRFTLPVAHIITNGIIVILSLPHKGQHKKLNQHPILLNNDVLWTGCLCPLQNPYGKILTPKGMVLGGGPGSEGGAPINSILAILKVTLELLPFSL